MAEPQLLGQSPPARRRLPLPQEHGSWIILLGPAALGALVGQAAGWPTLLVFVTGLLLFLVRQPLRGDGGPFWLVTYGGLACLFGLRLLWLYPALAWLTPIGALALLVEWWGGRGLARRSLVWQLLGSAGLCLMGPATFIASGGSLGPTAWGLYLLCYVGLGLGVAYVGLLLRWVRYAELSWRLRWQTGWWLPVGALLGHGACWWLGRLGWLSPEVHWALVPVVMRSLWAVPFAPRVTQFKRVGQVETLFATIFVSLAAWLW